MYKLSDATKLFAELDGISDPAGSLEYKKFDKSIRDISQRFYLPPAAMKGRSAEYSLPQICALRLIQVAYSFQLPRDRLNLLATFLSGNIAGTNRTVIEEAVARTIDGEKFEISIELRRPDDFQTSVNWEKGHSKRVSALLKSLEREEPWDARVCLPASRLISDILAQTNPDQETR